MTPKLKNFLNKKKLSAEELRARFLEESKLDRLKLLGAQERKFKKELAEQPFDTNLPTPLALCLKEFYASTTGAESLWMACNFLELVLKFCFAAAVVEGRGRGAHFVAMPKPLARKIQERLKAPGLGEWLELCEDALEWNAGPSPLPTALRATVTAVRELKNDKRMWQLRNQLAHGGWLKKSKIDVTVWLPAYLSFVASSLGWLESAELIAHSGGNVWLYRGERPTVHARRRFMWEGACELVTMGHSLDISPFATANTAVTSVYTRSKRASIDYLSYGGSVDWWTDENLRTARKFVEKFCPPAFQWLPTPFADFLLKQGDTLLAADLCNSLTRTVRQRLESGGLVWVHGADGSGKSSVLANLAGNRVNQANTALLFAYRFEQGSFLNRRDCFLQYVYRLLSLARWRNSWIPPKDDDDAFESPATISVSEVLSLLDQKKCGEKGRLLFVLDGIDEIIAEDPAFLDEVLVPLLRDQRIVVVGAGLSHGPIEAKIKGSDIRISSVEIPPLSLEDFTALLCKGCGGSSAKLLELQAQGARESRAIGVQLEQQRFVPEGNGQQFFGFLEAAHRKGKGSPLYATYLAEDLRSGTVKVGDVEALPDGLEGYHNFQLERTGVLRMLNPVPTPVERVALAEFTASIEIRRERERTAESRAATSASSLFNPVDEHLARASVLALLATDSNAATEDEITQRLRFTVLRGQTPEECLTTVEHALTAVGPLLKSAPIDESGKEGFAIASPSVRRHLNKLGGVLQMERRFARRPQLPPSANPERPPLFEGRWRERAREDRPNTPEIEERVAACVKGMENLEHCFAVSELSSLQNNEDPEDRFGGQFKGTIDEAVAELQNNRDLRLGPSAAFKALPMMELDTNFDWSSLLRRTPNMLRSATWREPSLIRDLYHDLDRYSHVERTLHWNWRGRLRPPRNDASTKPLVSVLDLHLNGWIRAQTEIMAEGVSVSGVATAGELHEICKTVAEILDLVRDGADLRALDACPVAIGISVRRGKEHSRARVYSVVFLFKDLPATVVLR
jgi:hypothetical protein